MLVAYVHGGVRFFTLAILSALIMPVALVPAARLAGNRWVPLAVLALVIVSGITGTEIARAGFETLKPVSVIDEEIAKDPTSPIALATAIARKTGSTPGSTGGRFHVISIAPVLALTLVDPRRRPVVAAMVYGVVLFAMSGWTFVAHPAFAPQVPGPGEAAAALALTVAAGAVGGQLARWLSDALAPESASAR